MPISKDEFYKRWDAPPVRRALDGSAWRALFGTAADQAGTVVGWAGVVAAAAALVGGAGIAQYADASPGSHPSVTDYVLFDLGLALMGVAVLAGLIILVALFKRNIAAWRWRVHVGQLARQGQLLRQGPHQGGARETERLDWYQAVIVDLAGHDPSGAVLIRFEEAPDVGVSGWLDERVANLVAYLGGLP